MKSKVEYWITRYDAEIGAYYKPCVIPHYTKKEILEQADAGELVATCKTLKEVAERYKKDFACYTRTSVELGNGNAVFVEATLFLVERCYIDEDGEADHFEIVRLYAEPLQKTRVDVWGKTDRG